MKYVPRIMTYLRPYWRLAVSSGIVTGVSVLISLLAPWPLMILVDSVLGDQPLPSPLAGALGDWETSRSSLLLFAVLAGLGMTFLSSALHVVADFVNTKLEQRLVLDFRCELFNHAQRLSLAFHDQKKSGKLIYAINMEADAAGSLIMSIQPLIQSALTLVGMLWITFQIDPWLSLLSLVIMPLLYFSVRYYATHIQEKLRWVKGMESDSLHIVHEAISMLRVIVAFGREGYELNRFRTQGSRTVDERVKLTVHQTSFTLAVNMITGTGTALVLGFGAYQALQGQLTVGQLLVVMSYIAGVYKPLEAISYTIGSLQDQFVGLQMAFAVLDTDPEIKDAPGASTIHRARGRVTFEGVSFSYPTRVDTLTDISFEAKPGQVVAIVGPTGAGKSTLMGLIPRFYDPHAGHILLDGTDVRKLTVKSVRDQISLVLQEPLLFGGSIAENIRYGRLDSSMDEVIAAAKAANAHDFIMGLPNQYETELGERGTKLSGGERQRIAVARAFLKDAPILILDEPTSAIDSKTEAVILDALDELMIGRTTFMIAHRLSTVRHADIILVMQRGQIVQRGTHDELLQQDGLYKQLYDLQTRSAERRSRQLLTALPGGAGRSA